MDHVTPDSLDASMARLNGSRRPAVADPLPPDEIVKSAVRQFSAMSGRDVEAVIGWDRTDQGMHIEVEVVEVRQTPKVADIMATYDADVNDRGRLCSYRRRRRYARGQVSNG